MPAHLLSSAPSAPEARFRDRLQQALAERCGRNPRYSLRAFANFLGIEHATLSQLLRGKRAITAATIRRLGGRIGLEAAQIERYVEAEARGADSEASSVAFLNLAEDAAKALADGVAFAVLELMRLSEFRPDVGWIERMLGCSPDAIHVALQQLIRLGFLRMEAHDRWVDLTGGAILREAEFTRVALERVLRRSHALQETSLRIAPEDPRFHGAVTLAVEGVDAVHLFTLAERLLADLRGDPGVARAARSGAAQLYHCEVHCYPISTPTSLPETKG